MTAGELITLLSMWEPNTPVYRDDREWGPLLVKRAVFEPGLRPFTWTVTDPPVVGIVIQ